MTEMGRSFLTPVTSNISASSVGKTREGCAGTWPHPPYAVSPSVKKLAHGVHLFWGLPAGRITPKPAGTIMDEVAAAMAEYRVSREATAEPT